MAANTPNPDAELLAKAKAAAERRAALKAKRDEAREAREGETKADAFKRIAQNRVNKALDAIATLRGLSNKANYDYTDEQVVKILTVLTAEIDKVKADFHNGGVAKSETRISL